MFLRVEKMGFWVDGIGVPLWRMGVGKRLGVEIVDKFGVGVENLSWLLKKGRLVLGKSMQGLGKNLVWFLEEGYLVWKWWKLRMRDGEIRDAWCVN